MQTQQNFLAFMAAWEAEGGLRPATDIALECPRLTTFPIELEVIEFNRKIFELSRPNALTLSQEDGLWIYDCKELGILSAGDTTDEALNSFSEDFSVMWHEIAECPDESLTQEAQDLKKRFRALVNPFKRK